MYFRFDLIGLVISIFVIFMLHFIRIICLVLKKTFFEDLRLICLLSQFISQIVVHPIMLKMVSYVALLHYIETYHKCKRE